MTIVFSALTDQSVIVGADRLRSANDGTTSNVVKIRALSPRVVVAKGGFGDLTDDLWEHLAALPANVKADAVRAAEEALKLARPIRERCTALATKLGIEDLGLFLIVGGLDVNDRPYVAATHVGTEQKKEFYGEADPTIVGIGSIPDAQAIAFAAAQSVYSRHGSVVAKPWAAEVVHQASRVDPKTIGFPLDGAIVTVDGLEMFELMQPSA